MKKNKDLMLKLLSEKEGLSFKDISIKTGYHEKSLIRIKRLQENNKYKFRNLTLKEKENILNLYLNSNIKNIKKFYNYYLIKNKQFPVRSYSAVQKIIKEFNNEKKSNYIIIGNIFDKNSFERTFYAYDFDNKEILYLERGFKDSYKVYFKIVKYIELNYKDKTIVFKGNCFLKNKRGIKYESFINYLNKNKMSYNFDKIYLPKKIIEKISDANAVVHSNINIVRDLSLEKIIIVEEDRKVLDNNIIEYKNVKYSINTKKIISKGKSAKIIFYLFDKSPYVKIDNIIYNLTGIYKKQSKKKYS